MKDLRIRGFMGPETALTQNMIFEVFDFSLCFVANSLYSKDRHLYFEYLLGVSLAGVSFFGFPLACMMAFSKNATRPENRNYATPSSGFLEKTRKNHKRTKTAQPNSSLLVFAMPDKVPNMINRPGTIFRENGRIRSNRN